MKIAIAQLNPTIADLSGNAQQIITVAQQAANADARLLLTPELSLCGYPPRDLLLNPGFVEAMAAQLQELAQHLPSQLAVLVGTVQPNPQAASAGEKPLFNSIALLEGGQVQQIFHKRLLPTYDVFDEERYFEPGRQSNSFTLNTLVETAGGQRSRGAEEQERAEEQGSKQVNPSPPHLYLTPHPSLKIGVTICEDLWNDEQFWEQRNYEVNPIEDLAHLGVDIVVNLSASPYSVGKQTLREAMLSHSAHRYQQPILYINQVGGNDDLLFDGASVAFNRAGEIVSRASAFQTDWVMLEFDEQKKDLLGTSVAPLPESENSEIWSALVMGVRDYAHKCGFSEMVVGLSGGIDSSLVAAIAAKAFGADNVLGVLMPSPYSSEGSLQDAQALVNNLGICSAKLPIGEAMQAYNKTLEPLFAGTSFGVAEENLQARIRGNLLMAVANKFGYLLISTGNKSEMAVGYSTLYGDMSGGLAAISDVPKTRVYSLCCWLNQTSATGEIVPANILCKPPSAELRPDQTDQDSLPSYEVLDEILHRIIHKHQSTTQIVDEAGYDPAVVNQVMKMVARAEFKRRQAPPGLKITDRAFGTGWRMPIASRSVVDNQWLMAKET